MFSDQVKGFSEESPSEALAEAISGALHESKGAAHTHIFVQQIVKVGKGWRAIVSLVVNSELPKIQPEVRHTKNISSVLTHAKKTPLPPKKIKKKRTPADKQPVSSYDPEEEKEAERNRHQVHEQHMKEKYAAMQSLELDRTEALYKEEDQFEYIYMQITNEAVFRLIENRFNFDYVHVLDGSLWEEANRHHPDIELYESTLEHNPAPLDQPADSSPKNEAKPKFFAKMVNKFS